MDDDVGGALYRHVHGSQPPPPTDSYWPLVREFAHTSLSPNGKLLVIVGDNPDGMLVDSQTGKTMTALSGHLDFSFASAWHPDGITFATGNQDKTCRVWDVRNLSKSVAVLKGNLGAIRSIRYTSDGQYMMMAEPADFVHVYDVKSGYEKEQEIDFFGEISGISFSPDTESLFIGVWDRTSEQQPPPKTSHNIDVAGKLEFGGLVGKKKQSGAPLVSAQVEARRSRSRPVENEEMSAL
ncbi:hypothetical protein ACLB2K_030862 [Fragaria x ananassa]